jgi:WD40 repeat protein
MISLEKENLLKLIFSTYPPYHLLDIGKTIHNNILLLNTILKLHRPLVEKSREDANYQSISKLYLLPSGNIAVIFGGMFNTHPPKGNREFKEYYIGGVMSIVSLPNENIALGRYDMISIHDPADQFNLVKSIHGHTDAVVSLTVVKGRYLVSGSWDKTIRVWDIENDFSRMKILKAQSSSINFLLCNRNFLISAGNRTIGIWSIDSFDPIEVVKGHSERITCVALLNEDSFASGSYDKTAILWDCNYTAKHVLKHEGMVSSIVSLGYECLATASVDHLIRVWNGWNNYSCVKVIVAQGRCSLLLLPNYDFMSGSNDGLKKWGF